MPVPVPVPARLRYAERLSPPWWLWLVVGFFVLSLAVAVLPPLGPAAALASLLLAGGMSAWVLVRASARIEVDEAELRAGRAHVPLALLGPVTPLDPAAARHLRLAGADARAYHLLRGWVPTAVRVDLADPADPTPYWYVSSRHPHRLAGAIEAARGGSEPPQMP